jgi:peptidyl-prolyl cis-trans isomerase SurA
VRVPESASREQVATLRKKAEDILARLKSGEDFASLAAAASDGPEALQGGVMGERPLEGWPDLFVNAVANLGKGQISGILQSGNGFHILKVLDRRTAGAPARGPAQTPARAPEPAPNPNSDNAVQLPQGPMQVTQTHARHILIKTSTVMSDDEARQRLVLLRQRIVDGKEDFGVLARQNSQDASAPQGGDLGWLNPGETVPEFEQVMNSLRPGEVSQPVHSRFGWHLIQVLERREKDVKDEVQRLQARRVLFERRSELAFDDWLEQLRDQAYIDNRLEKQQDRQDGNNR